MHHKTLKIFGSTTIGLLASLAMSGGSIFAATVPSSNVPATDVTTPVNYINACESGDAGACTVATVQDIDSARNQIGLGALMLPTNYNQLTVPEQLFVLVNIARVDRGFSPVAGLNTQMNAGATEEVASGSPPSEVNAFGNGTQSASQAPIQFSISSQFIDGTDNYNYGYLNPHQVMTPLEAMYDIMYHSDATPNNYAMESTPGGLGGYDFGVRDSILTHFNNTPLVAGAAVGTFNIGVNSVLLNYMAEPINGAVPPLSYTWSQALAAGANSANGWNPIAEVSTPTPTPTPTPATGTQEPAGSLWRVTGTNPVYVVTSSNTLFHVPSPLAFKELGLQWDQVHVMANLPSLNLSTSMSIPTGTFWRKNGTSPVYIVTPANTLYHIPNPTVFYAFHGSWKQVKAVAQLPNLAIGSSFSY